MRVKKWLKRVNMESKGVVNVKCWCGEVFDLLVATLEGVLL
jgi:hypothetical protein